MRGTLYDGTTAFPHAVTVSTAGNELELTTETAHRLVAPLDTLVRTDEGGRVRLGRSDVSGWRLLLDEPLDPDLAARLPRPGRYGGWIDRFGLGKAAAACAVVAAAVVAVGYTAPHWLAPHVPVGWERNLGDSIVGDFGDNRCRSPSGQRALETLAERIEPGVTRGPDRIRFAAFDVNIFNAAAIPGNHIIVFKQMIARAQNSDELTGVLAHEIAHVRRRHVTEALLREFGIGALIRLFAGGIGANAQQVASLSYTRANEAQADADAIAALRRANVDPRPTARLFARLAKETGEDRSYSVEWLKSHPASGGRAKLFAASFDPTHRYQRSLSPDQAFALNTACVKFETMRLPQGPTKPDRVTVHPASGGPPGSFEVR
ncbi:M48 family metallopeptidase [Sphingomonas sp. BN140010]|uniref:M48 family metallopeptidase n=1 Tax=Sphingomonas arvum TaxID=2992113 RepID=A0ABT3JFI1_9SPHN|nr:M48 family metallopeptidase [Sphingomonas sp. BN140010]MCW3797826.1 M48 family metallopeptidase [Sphingomonas sp. BN140010]